MLNYSALSDVSVLFSTEFALKIIVFKTRVSFFVVFSSILLYQNVINLRFKKQKVFPSTFKTSSQQCSNITVWGVEWERESVKKLKKKDDKRWNY